MHITLSPSRRDDRLTLSKKGDTLTINGEAFDLSAIPDGATLPRDAVACEWPASLDSFLDYLTPAQARDVQIDWAACATVQRLHPFVLTLGSWLGLSDADLDALFGI